MAIQNGRQVDFIIYFQRQHVAPSIDPSNADHQLTGKDGQMYMVSNTPEAITNLPKLITIDRWVDAMLVFASIYSSGYIDQASTTYPFA